MYVIKQVNITVPLLLEKFEDTKVVTRAGKLKDRKFNGQRQQTNQQEYTIQYIDN